MAKQKTILMMEDTTVFIVRTENFDAELLEGFADAGAEQVEEILDQFSFESPLFVRECVDILSARRLLLEITAFLGGDFELPVGELQSRLNSRFSN